MLYHLFLFLLAMIGALRAGIWVINGNRWRWYWKAVGLLILVFATFGFLNQVYAGSSNDLRILTEILATGGTVFLLEWGFRRVRNQWWRSGFVLAAMVCLFLIWIESIDRLTQPQPLTGQVPSANSSTVFVPNRTNQQPDRKQLCKEGKLSKHSCD